MAGEVSRKGVSIKAFQERRFNYSVLEVSTCNTACGLIGLQLKRIFLKRFS